MNNRVRTSLQGKQPKNPWNDDELRANAKRLWQATGTIMVKPDWIKDDWDKQQQINVAIKLFGERKT